MRFILSFLGISRMGSIILILKGSADIISSFTKAPPQDKLLTTFIFQETLKERTPVVNGILTHP
jgi:hypothetical protein